MTRVLLAGAGAEVDLGFLSGPNFTRDTFYCKKKRMTESLRSFYSSRLGKKKDGCVPTDYDPAFLFNVRGIAFLALLENLLSKYPSLISRILDKSQEDCRKLADLNEDDKKVLFNALIVEAGVPGKLPTFADGIPDDAHFSTLESYYSDLLEPNKNPVRFWKIINFYWSAFFSILLPITNRIYGSNGLYSDDPYAFVLSNLDEIVHDVFQRDNCKKMMSGDCYYNSLRGRFDAVLTTNYTPYAATIVEFDSSRLARLSGSLAQFEHLANLEFMDYSNPEFHIGEADFIFPYLLCQSPVKPIISLNQMLEFGGATEALINADEIVVLGYSFCEEDAHICSMVGEVLRGGRAKKLTYFSYWPNSNSDFDCASVSKELAKKLRVSNDIATEKIDVVPVANCHSREFVSRCDQWTA